MNSSQIAEKAAALAVDDAVDWSSLAGKRVLVTGATGMICSQLVRALIERNALNVDAGVDIVIAVRNADKARALFGSPERLSVVEWAMGDELNVEDVDVIVHGASPTGSKDFLDHPVDTARSIVLGATAVLECARKNNARIVYMSTMEVYGSIESGTSSRVDETVSGGIDSMLPRSSYPLSKKFAENLCAGYFAQFGVEAVVLRLAQTFGMGVVRDDARVFAEFARLATSGEDIVLFSDGKKRNSYLSVDDAVRAILIAAVRGEGGQAYNVANPATDCSILEMAEFVCERFGRDGASVTFGVDVERAKTFRPSSDLELDVSKIEGLGWRPTEGLHEMYDAMIRGWGEAPGADAPTRARR